MDVDAPPDIIDVDEDDDIINDEDVLPRDLAYSDNEDLATDDEDLTNDDDDVAIIYSIVSRGHDGHDRPPPGKGTQKPNRGGRKVGRLDTRGQTRNFGLRRITDQWGRQMIRFEFNDRGTLMPLGDYAAHWSNLLGEFLMHYPSWHKIEPERKARSRGDLLEEDMRILKRSKEFRREDVIENEKDE
nr:hypothetical protein [Tanacetum cinerariifolium]